MRAYSIPRRLSTCKGGGITATGGNKKCFEKRKRGKIVTDGRSASGRYMSSSSSSQTDRFSALFCSLCCQFSRTLRKETNSSDFVTRLVLFPRRKERASETRTSYVRRAASSPTFSGQDRLPKTASERPFVDSTFRFYPQCAQDPS